MTETPSVKAYFSGRKIKFRYNNLIAEMKGNKVLSQFDKEVKLFSRIYDREKKIILQNDRFSANCEVKISVISNHTFKHGATGIGGWINDMISEFHSMINDLNYKLYSISNSRMIYVIDNISKFVGGDKHHTAIKYNKGGFTSIDLRLYYLLDYSVFSKDEYEEIIKQQIQKYLQKNRDLKKKKIGLQALTNSAVSGLEGIDRNSILFDFDFFFNTSTVDVECNANYSIKDDFLIKGMEREGLKVYFTKELIDRINNMKIEFRKNLAPYPHKIPIDYKAQFILLVKYLVKDLRGYNDGDFNVDANFCIGDLVPLLTELFKKNTSQNLDFYKSQMKEFVQYSMGEEEIGYTNESGEMLTRLIMDKKNENLVRLFFNMYFQKNFIDERNLTSREDFFGLYEDMFNNGFMDTSTTTNSRWTIHNNSIYPLNSEGEADMTYAGGSGLFKMIDEYTSDMMAEFLSYLMVCWLIKKNIIESVKSSNIINHHTQSNLDDVIFQRCKIAELLEPEIPKEREVSIINKYNNSNFLPVVEKNEGDRIKSNIRRNGKSIFRWEHLYYIAPEYLYNIPVDLHKIDDDGNPYFCFSPYTENGITHDVLGLWFMKEYTQLELPLENQIHIEGENDTETLQSSLIMSGTGEADMSHYLHKYQERNNSGIYTELTHLVNDMNNEIINQYTSSSSTKQKILTTMQKFHLDKYSRELTVWYPIFEEKYFDEVFADEMPQYEEQFEYDDQIEQYIHRNYPRLTLFPYQYQDAVRMACKGRALLTLEQGLGKCVHPDTNIIINGKTTKAKDIWNRYSTIYSHGDGGITSFPSKKLMVETLTEGGKIRKGRISSLWKQRISEKIRRVKLENGNEIQLTQQHKLFDGTDWKNNLKVGDFIAVPSKVTMGKGKFIDHDLIDYMAWLISEGYERKYSFDITQKDKSILISLKKKIMAFGNKVGIELNKPSIKKDERNGIYRLLIHSKDLTEYLENRGYKKNKKSKFKDIPDFIVNAHPEGLRRFLRQYFDAEGSCSASGIELSSASIRVMKKIRLMLKKFGISIRIKEKFVSATNSPEPQKRKYYRGNINGNDLRLFAYKIGFGIEYKQKKVEELCKKRENPNYDYIPIGQKIIQLQKKLNLPNWIVLGERRGTEYLKEHGSTRFYKVVKNNLLKILDGEIVHLINEREIKNELKSEYIEKINSLSFGQLEHIRGTIILIDRWLKSDIRFEKIVEIEEYDYSGYVYDFTVEETHNYVAEDIVCHNTRTSIALLILKGLQNNLIVCDRKLIKNWEQEFRELGIGSDQIRTLDYRTKAGFENEMKNLLGIKESEFQDMWLSYKDGEENMEYSLKDFDGNPIYMNNETGKEVRVIDGDYIDDGKVLDDKDLEDSKYVQMTTSQAFSKTYYKSAFVQTVLKQLAHKIKTKSYNKLTDENGNVIYLKKPFSTGIEIRATEVDGKWVYLDENGDEISDILNPKKYKPKMKQIFWLSSYTDISPSSGLVHPFLTLTGNDGDNVRENPASDILKGIQKQEMIQTKHKISGISKYFSNVFDSIVVDESQKLKTTASSITKDMLTFKAKLKVLLSGTPMTKTLADLISQIDFVYGIGTYYFPFDYEFIQREMVKRVATKTVSNELKLRKKREKRKEESPLYEDVSFFEMHRRGDLSHEYTDYDNTSFSFQTDEKSGVNYHYATILHKTLSSVLIRKLMRQPECKNTANPSELVRHNHQIPPEIPKFDYYVDTAKVKLEYGKGKNQREWLVEIMDENNNRPIPILQFQPIENLDSYYSYIIQLPTAWNFMWTIFQLMKFREDLSVLDGKTKDSEMLFDFVEGNRKISPIRTEGTSLVNNLRSATAMPELLTNKQLSGDAKKKIKCPYPYELIGKIHYQFRDASAMLHKSNRVKLPAMSGFIFFEFPDIVEYLRLANVELPDANEMGGHLFSGKQYQLYGDGLIWEIEGVDKTIELNEDLFYKHRFKHQGVSAIAEQYRTEYDAMAGEYVPKEWLNPQTSKKLLEIFEHFSDKSGMFIPLMENPEFLSVEKEDKKDIIVNPFELENTEKDHARKSHTYKITKYSGLNKGLSESDILEKKNKLLSNKMKEAIRITFSKLYNDNKVIITDKNKDITKKVSSQTLTKKALRNCFNFIENINIDEIKQMVEEHKGEEICKLIDGVPTFRHSLYNYLHENILTLLLIEGIAETENVSGLDMTYNNLKQNFVAMEFWVEYRKMYHALMDYWKLCLDERICYIPIRTMMTDNTINQILSDRYSDTEFPDDNIGNPSDFHIQYGYDYMGVSDENKVIIKERGEEIIEDLRGMFDISWQYTINNMNLDKVVDYMDGHLFKTLVDVKNKFVVSSKEEIIMNEIGKILANDSSLWKKGLALKELGTLRKRCSDIVDEYGKGYLNKYADAVNNILSKNIGELSFNKLKKKIEFNLLYKFLKRGEVVEVASVTASSRFDKIQKFREIFENAILIATVGTIATGFNINEGNAIIMNSPHWSSSEQEQTMRRIIRPQSWKKWSERPLKEQFSLLFEGSIDSFIFDTVQVKRIGNEKIIDINMSEDFTQTAVSHREQEKTLKALSKKGIDLLKERRRPATVDEIQSKKDDYFWGD